MTPTPQHSDEDRLLGHAYDGIQEYDNPMPRWWLWGFYACVLFALIYWLEPSRTLAGPGREAEYGEEMARFAAAHPAPAGGADPAMLAAAAEDETRRERGAAVYTQNCAACHRADGGGLIGPNLTDRAWLHGGRPEQVYRTIAEGVLAKGMPAWAKMLKDEQLVDVTAYVLHLHERPAEGGKPAEGAVEAGGDDDDAEREGK